MLSEKHTSLDLNYNRYDLKELLNHPIEYKVLSNADNPKQLVMVLNIRPQNSDQEDLRLAFECNMGELSLFAYEVLASAQKATTSPPQLTDALLRKILRCLERIENKMS